MIINFFSPNFPRAVKSFNYSFNSVEFFSQINSLIILFFSVLLDSHKSSVDFFGVVTSQTWSDFPNSSGQQFNKIFDNKSLRSIYSNCCVKKFIRFFSFIFREINFFSIRRCIIFRQIFWFSSLISLLLSKEIELSHHILRNNSRIHEGKIKIGWFQVVGSGLSKGNWYNRNLDRNFRSILCLNLKRFPVLLWKYRLLLNISIVRELLVLKFVETFIFLRDRDLS